MTGPTDHVRVGTRSVGEGTCPDYAAAKAHPALWPAERLRARKEKLDTFPLGVLNAALDEIEINGATVAQAIDRAVGETEQEGKRLHPGVLTWARTAVGRYLAGAALLPAPGSVRDPGHGAGAGLLGGSGGPPVQRGPPVGDVRLPPAGHQSRTGSRPGDPAPALRDLRSQPSRATGPAGPG